MSSGKSEQCEQGQFACAQSGGGVRLRGGAWPKYFLKWKGRKGDQREVPHGIGDQGSWILDLGLEGGKLCVLTSRMPLPCRYLFPIPAKHCPLSAAH